MKYNTGVLAAIAVGIVSVRASPVDLQTRTPGVRTDPFVSCIRQTYPQFPREGDPSVQEIQTCSDQIRPRAKRETMPTEHSTGAPMDGRDNATRVTPRGGAIDAVNVLGQLMSLGLQPECTEKDNSASTLHNQFVWAQDVIGLADGVCDEVTSAMEGKGLNEMGGAGQIARTLKNAMDEKGGRILNNKDLLLTVITNVYPPVGKAVDGVKAVADGLHAVCSAGIKKILNPQDGCTRNVKWYISQKAKHGNELAALGGVIDVVLGSANSPVGSIRIGFSDDG